MTSSPISEEMCQMSLATAAMPAASDDPQRTSLVAGTKAIVDLSRTTTGQTQSLFHPQPQYSTMGDLTNIRRNQSLDPKLLRSRSNSERSEATRLSDDDSAACKAGDSSADRYMEVDVERPITEGIRQYIIQEPQQLTTEPNSQSNTCYIINRVGSTLSTETFTNCRHNSKPVFMGSLSVVNGSIELRASLIIVSCRSRNNSTRMLQIDPKIPRQWTNNKKVLTTPYKLVINIEKGTDGVEIFTTTQEFIIKDSNHRYALLSRDQWQEYNHIPEVYVSIKLMKYEDLVVTDPTDEDEDDFVKITTADP